MNNHRKSKLFFVAIGLLLQAVALLLMATDKSPSGFGIQTLWVAPISLFAGIIMPILGLVQLRSFKDFIADINHLKFLGAGLSFSLALITYILTLEPTASLWDCGETIAAAYKLQVPHTPGIPLTLLLGRLFSCSHWGMLLR